MSEGVKKFLYQQLKDVITIYAIFFRVLFWITVAVLGFWIGKDIPAALGIGIFLFVAFVWPKFT